LTWESADHPILVYAVIRTVLLTSVVNEQKIEFRQMISFESLTSAQNTAAIYVFRLTLELLNVKEDILSSLV